MIALERLCRYALLGCHIPLFFFLAINEKVVFFSLFSFVFITYEFLFTFFPPPKSRIVHNSALVAITLYALLCERRKCHSQPNRAPQHHHPTYKR